MEAILINSCIIPDMPGKLEWNIHTSWLAELAWAVPEMTSYAIKMPPIICCILISSHGNWLLILGIYRGLRALVIKTRHLTRNTCSNSKRKKAIEALRKLKHGIFLNENWIKKHFHHVLFRSFTCHYLQYNWLFVCPVRSSEILSFLRSRYRHSVWR